MNVELVGNGKVVLLAGGGKIFTDIAAKFVGSERSLEEIIASEYDKKLVKRILDSGHLAATEFDYFIFGVDGYSRVTETQLVRKRIASYIIKSGRIDKKGKRQFDIVLPKRLLDHYVIIDTPSGPLTFTTAQILRIIEQWYNEGVSLGVPEEELRYLKPQATEFKGLIGMNAHALMDWFAVRCCKRAQTEIRDMANKMLALCKDAAPDLFAQAGPNCKVFGYCPENDLQHKDCQGKVVTKQKALLLLKKEK